MPTAMPGTIRRRAVVQASLGTAFLAGLSIPTRAHDSYGVVDPPRLVARLRIASLERGTTELAELMRGRVTALQLMFTSCSATCPIQGAVFAEVQQRLRSEPKDFRLVSVSIDPLGDDAKALRAWLHRFGADPARWTAAVIAPEHLDALFNFLQGRASGSDQHTAQVYLFDRQARLVYRTLEMPPASSVVSLMEQVSQRYP
jgi:protein SCO1/2